MIASPSRRGPATASPASAHGRHHASAPPSALASLVASAALRVASRVQLASGARVASRSLASGSLTSGSLTSRSLASRSLASHAAASRLAVASRVVASRAGVASRPNVFAAPPASAPLLASRFHLASRSHPASGAHSSARFGLASAAVPQGHAASVIASAAQVASVFGRTVRAYAPQLAPYPRTALASINADQLASAVLHVLASLRTRHAASPVTPTRYLASAIARRISSPTFHVASGALSGVASRLGSAVSRRLSASPALRVGETDAGAALAKGTPTPA